MPFSASSRYDVSRLLSFSGRFLDALYRDASRLVLSWTRRKNVAMPRNVYILGRPLWRHPAKTASRLVINRDAGIMARLCVGLAVTGFF
jgi:hypothetical protein